MNLYEARADFINSVCVCVCVCVCERESRTRVAPHLVEVFLLLLDFGDVEQQTPHLPSELQGDSLIDPPDQLEGNTQQEVIVREAFKEQPEHTEHSKTSGL